MKINKKNSTQQKKSVFIISIIAAVLLVAISAAILIKVAPNSNQGSTINLDKPTEEQLQTGDDIKNEANGENSQTGSDPALPPKAIEGSDQKTVNTEITAANIDGAVLHVRTLIQYVTTTGSCTLTLTGPQQRTYTATAAIQAMPSSSTCRGFDIALSDLSSGEWKIELSFVDSNIIGSSSSKVLIP